VSTGTPAPRPASTSRLEAFSDGIFAIAATLLVLDLRVPDDVVSGGLAHALGQLWPNYAAYVVSFATIGIIWMNHHAQIDRIARADRGLLTLNLVLLLFVSVIPFPTSMLARFLRAGSDQHVAAAVYSGTLLAMGVSFFAMFTYARRTGLIVDQISPEAARFLTIRNLAGLLPYAIAVGVAFVSAPASLALCGAVALYYLLPERLLGLPDA
jgi:uncharacterized membrane protein